MCQNFVMKFTNMKIVFLVISSLIIGATINNALDHDNGNKTHFGNTVFKKNELREQVIRELKRNDAGIDKGNIVKMLLAYLGIKIENKKLRQLVNCSKENVKEKPLSNQQIEDCSKCQNVTSLNDPDLLLNGSAETNNDISKSKKTTLKLSELKEIKKTKLWLTPITAESPKLYLTNSKPFKQKHFLIENIQGSLSGQIILSNQKKIRIKIRSDYKYKNHNYLGTSYVEMSNSRKTYFVSSNENGKNSNFRIEESDEIPLLIIKIRPHHFLRLKQNQNEKSFSGHLYSLDSTNKFYKLVGEINNLR